MQGVRREASIVDVSIEITANIVVVDVKDSVVVRTRIVVVVVVVVVVSVGFF